MKIAFLGDVILAEKFCLKQNQDLFNYFRDVSQLLSKYDYVVANLETPFVTNQKPYGPKSAHIKSDPKNTELLKFLNINIVTLANNHIYDYGKESYELTKKLLNDNDIQYFGVENLQVYIEKNKTKVAFHGYCCYSTNPFGLDKGVNVLDIDIVEKQLINNHKNGYFNIVGIHCGQEHVHTPSYDHVLMARRFSKVCPYLFYGHHPHVIQSIEEHQQSLIAYSLGNFCIDKVYTKKSERPIFVPSEYNKRSFILEVELDDNKIISYNTIPIYIGEESIEIGKEDILNNIQSYSKELEKDETVYQKERQEKISAYINSRKEMRDFNWYLKRLNIGSVKHIINTRNNSKLYKKHITKKL